ncbi:MAG: chemotaxis protein CheW [Acetivibrionales bacterium]|mgnify:CR=1 FL=1|jgi:purine-binding chemotaxis protein CheW
MAIKQFIQFYVGDEVYVIGLTEIYQILKPQEIFKVPNTPPFIEGFLNLRGKVLTVFNLRERFNMPIREIDSDTRILIINYKDMLLGFIVDSVTEIIRVPEEEIVDVPDMLDNVNRRYLANVAKVDEKLILILDLDKILTPDEESQVVDMVKQHKEDVLK